MVPGVDSRGGSGETRGMAPRPHRNRGEVRVPGALVLAGIVLLGLASGAAYLHYKAPKLAAELEERIAAVPKTPEGRLEQWLLMGAPQIHHRLSKFGRFATAYPWLVTHAIDDGDGVAPELWGIDCEALPQELAHLEGLTVVVELPAPRSLGRAPLAGSMADFIPLYERGSAIPDPIDRLHELALYLLGRVPAALANDIPGASLQIRIAGSND